jgi:hypothetical protein
MSKEPENSEDWFTSPIRKVIREPLFLQQLDGLALSHRRINEVLSALEYSLARHPEMFIVQGLLDCGMVKTSFYPNAPALRILFTFTTTEVHLFAVEFAE